MIAIDITKFLKSYPHVRGPAVFLNAFIRSSLDRDIYFIFNPHFVGNQLYFNTVSAKEYPAFYEQYYAPPTPQPYQRFRKRLILAVLRRARNIAVKIIPNSAAALLILQRSVNQNLGSQVHTRVVHHSCFKQVISFLASDSIWGLPMADTKKTLFLYDITFFEILRTISYPVICDSNLFIVQHINYVNRAISESHSVIVPTRYLAGQLPLHFPAARHLPTAVVPLAIAPMPDDFHFKPMRKTARKAASYALVVCGFDGFKADNKGIGNILDIIHLYTRLYPESTSVSFTLVTPALEELKQRIAKLGIENRVTLLSNLPAGELLEQYKRAKFLWVHSIDEGFCLPVVEASLLGRPALVSDVPSLREIWGDTVDYINAFNRYEAVAKLHEYIAGKRDSAEGANVIRAQSLTIQKTAKGVWDAMEEVALPLASDEKCFVMGNEYGSF